MITASHLTRRFGNIMAVHDISFGVRPGEVLGFLGPNGAGKSTTMKMMTGFLTPTEGSVSVCGFDMENNPVAAKERIGYLPEGAPAFPEMTPIQFLSFIADIRGLSLGKEARLKEVIAHLHLGSVLHQTIDTLSKGFKRRVGLAAAILHDPEVLILDEPTDGLDPNQKQEVRDLIKTLAKSKSIIISTHILEEVNAVCTRTIVIDKGKIAVDCSPEELASRSRYHQAVTFTLREPQPIQEALMALSGVCDIEVNEALKAYTVIPLPGEKIFPTVQAFIERGRWPIERLYVEEGRLEEVFRNLTVKEHV